MRIKLFESFSEKDYYWEISEDEFDSYYDEEELHSDDDRLVCIEEVNERKKEYEGKIIRMVGDRMDESVESDMYTLFRKYSPTGRLEYYIMIKYLILHLQKIYGINLFQGLQ